MSEYATITDVQNLWRTLTAAEQTKVNALLPIISDTLRQYAINNGRDLDDMIADGRVLTNVVKSVVVDIVKRYMDTISDESAPMTQMSQSALGYTVSGTYLSPGGGLFIKNAELERLGLRRQRIGGINLAARHRCDAVCSDA